MRGFIVLTIFIFSATFAIGSVGDYSKMNPILTLVSTGISLVCFYILHVYHVRIEKYGRPW